MLDIYVVKRPIIVAGLLMAAILRAWREAGKTERFFGPEGVNRDILMTAMAVEGATVVQVIPALLGQGIHLFDHLGSEHVRLNRTRVAEGPNGVTHLFYDVVRRGGVQRSSSRLWRSEAVNPEAARVGHWTH